MTIVPIKAINHKLKSTSPVFQSKLLVAFKFSFPTPAMIEKAVNGIIGIKNRFTNASPNGLKKSATFVDIN